MPNQLLISVLHAMQRSMLQKRKSCGTADYSQHDTQQRTSLSWKILAGVPQSSVLCCRKNHPREAAGHRLMAQMGAPYRPHHSAPQGAAAQTRRLLAHPAAPQTWLCNVPLLHSRAILPAAPHPGKVKDISIGSREFTWLWPAEIQNRQQLEQHFQDQISKHKFKNRTQNSMNIICRSSEEKRF